MNSIELLRRATDGDERAAAALYETCYEDLHDRAARLMRDQRAHTLQATALVNEAWMRLALPDADWESRGHFLAAATRAMRSVLVDHARAKLAEKRGGGAKREDLAFDSATGDEPSWRVLALDEAMVRLEEAEPTQAKVANLRLFAGLSHAEIAAVMGVTERSIERHWAAAREVLRSAT